jgi:hypothetical protein
MSTKKDVVCAFTNNISCTYVEWKHYQRHITLRSAENMAKCKLVGKILHLHTQWDFINDLVCLSRQMICLSNNHKFWLFLWFQGEKSQFSLRWPYSPQVPYYIFWVCISCFSYPAWKAHAPYFIVISLTAHLS